MPVSVLLTILAALALAAIALLLGNAGLRAGDRPGDVTVTAVMSTVTQPDERRPVVAATVANPGPAPVLVGLSVRPGRLPGWLTAGPVVTVPRHTTRRRLRPGSQDVAGVVGAGESARWTVPVPATARRCRLTAVIGQDGGRLRVIDMPVPPSPPQAARAVRTVA